MQNSGEHSRKDDVINSSLHFTFPPPWATCAFSLDIKHARKVNLAGRRSLRSQRTRLDCLSKSKAVFEAVTVASQIKQIGFRVLPTVIESKKCIVRGSPIYLYISLASARSTMRHGFGGNEPRTEGRRRRTEQVLAFASIGRGRAPRRSRVKGLPCLTRWRCQDITCSQS